MTEEIIYNKCCCYENGFCLWIKKYYETGITPKCKQVKDCYYKQLKRLEQENKELKELNKKNCEDWEKEIKVYWNALEEIRKNFMCFRTCILPFHIGNKENLPHKMADVIQNYCESIRNKIDEVLQ